MAEEISPSANSKIIAMIKIMMKTTMVVVTVSLRLGQVTFRASCRVSRINCAIFFAISFNRSFCLSQTQPAYATQSISTGWQERRDSNPHPVLETGTLPIELRSFKPFFPEAPRLRRPDSQRLFSFQGIRPFNGTRRNNPEKN